MKISLSAGVQDAERRVPDVFSEQPLSASRLIPAGVASGVDVFLPFLMRESERFVMFGESKRLRSLGFWAPGYKEPAASQAGGFSSLDMLPPAFLDLSLWGRFYEKNGMLFYVPTPSELEILLDGGVMAPGARAPGGGPVDNRLFYPAVPSLGSYSESEVSSYYGTRVTLALSKAAAVLEQGGEIGGGSKFLHTNVSRSIGRLVDSYVRLDHFSQVYHAEQGVVAGIEGMGGLEGSFDKAGWKKFLPGLKTAWEAREALLKTQFAKDEQARFWSSPSGFMLGTLRFGFGHDSVTNEQIAADLAATKDSLAIIFSPNPEGAPVAETVVNDESPYEMDYGKPLEQWDPRAFVFFLRCVNESVIRPLGLRGEKTAKLILGMLESAEKGRCFSADSFFRKFPGGRQGFRDYLDQAFELGGKLIEINRDMPQRDLPRVLNYKFSSGLSREESTYVSRSLGMNHSSRVLQASGEKPLRVAFPSFAAAWRVMTGSAQSWPVFPKIEGLTMFSLGQFLKNIPVGDQLLDCMRSAFMDLPDSLMGQSVPEDFYEALENYVSAFKRDCDAGLYGRPDVFLVQPLLTGEILPSRELGKLKSLLAEHNNTEGERFRRDFMEAVKKACDQDIAPLRFEDFSPLRPAGLVTFTRQEAEREIYGWFSKNGSDLGAFDEMDVAFMESRINSSKELSSLVDAVCSVCASIEEHFSTPLLAPPDLRVDTGLVLEGMDRLRAMSKEERFDPNCSGCVLNVLNVLKAAPFAEPLNTGVLDAGQRDFLGKLSKVEDHDGFARLLKNAKVVDLGENFDFAQVDKILSERKAYRQAMEWRSKACSLLEKLYDPVVGISRHAPMLSGAEPRFGVLLPDTLRQAVRGFMMGLTPPRLVASLRDSAAALSRGEWVPSLARAMMVHDEVVESAEELVSYGPVFRGLAVEEHKEGANHRVLHGLGALYYKMLGRRFPEALHRLGFEVDVRGLPEERQLDLLPVLDFTKLSARMCDAFAAHPLFSLSENSKPLEPFTGGNFRLVAESPDVEVSLGWNEKGDMA